MLIISKDLSLFCAREPTASWEKVGEENRRGGGNDLCSMHKGLAKFLNKRMNGGTEWMCLGGLRKFVIESSGAEWKNGLEAKD